MKKVIGIKANHYPEKRNFSELPVKGYQFKKKLDVYRIIAYAYFKWTKRTHPYWLNLFYDFNLGNYSGLHFFNAVNLGRKPWVTTFEFYLPRGAHRIGEFPKETKYINKVLSRLAHSSCKQLIALSEYAKRSQIDYLSKANSKLAAEIEKKIIVCHPPQKLHVRSVSEKKNNPDLELVLIGADFFRKGGMECLLAVERLLNENIRVKFTIVSSMQFGDYASGSTSEDLQKAMDIINSHSSIIHHTRLPNHEVIDLLKKSDVSLLPSYDETYGYTVLEAQSCGCPVITTNGAALTEINNDECGWVINVPLEEDKRSIPRTSENKKIFKEEVINGIVNIVKSITNNPDILKRKAQRSIERIEKHHSTENAAERLREIYDML